MSETQSILEHLNELRIRLTWALAGLAVTTVISFFFAEELLEFLLAPYGEQLQVTSPTENIETFFKVALVAGAVLAMPWMLLQLWLFVAPALERNERRFAIIFVPSAFALFLTGIAFCWFVLLPAAIGFLENFMPGIFFVEWTATEFISFETTFLFWLGVSFEMPLIIYLIARTGFVSSQTLREQWRLALVAIAVVAAAVTPSIDPVTMLLTMVPLILLYLLSILLAGLGQRQFARSMSIDA